MNSKQHSFPPMLKGIVEKNVISEHAIELAAVQASRMTDYKCTMLRPEVDEETPCVHCGKNDHPELQVVCSFMDCNKIYHCNGTCCARISVPPLDQEWFCSMECQQGFSSM